ncbi:MAG: hypothetical protein ABL921_02070 [Pirellula sp.]
MKTIQIPAIIVKAASFTLSVFSMYCVSSSAVNAQPAIAAPIQYWSSIHHSSTVTEGALRGQAEMISALATYQYMYSLAMVNQQEAYRRALANHDAQVQRYWEQRAFVADYRAKLLPKPFVGEPRRKAIERAMPKRLTASQFDARTGAIKWPYQLSDAKYQPAKKIIDAYFSRSNAESRGWGTECEVEVTRLCMAMEKLVCHRTNDLTPNQKNYVREFLHSVIRESQTPAFEASEFNQDAIGAE